ncbi:phosphopantetheine-binding protein [Streptomyces sp. NPDC090306]|uniref:phosphopantetheine-binding protein n=1 Tax=Streptomyces sp. NPDC090306 TaxID=3365961 RepID=UPI003802B5C3
MFEELKLILVDSLQVKEEDVLPTATREEIGLDSLAVLELVELLNDRLGVRVYDYELLDTITVADVAQLVDERRTAS